MTKQQLVKHEGRISILVNILLFGLKYWAGIVTGSVAIIADAWHTISDSISSIFVLIGAKVSEKPPDDRHPFGHGRAELITTIMIGIFLAFVAYEFTRESISRLLSHEQVHFGRLALFVTIVSILVKESLAQFAFWAWRKTNSKSLRADAWHHRTDALSSILVLIGILLGNHIWWIDGALGILIALLIFYSAFYIIRDSIDPLMGKKADRSIINKLKPLCSQICGESIQTHHFHIHEYGDHTELTFHIVFPSDYTLQVAHDLTNQIEMAIRDQFSIEATIHMEPRGDEQDYRPEEQKVI
ncbi:cation transporter [candidate division KSB1 bacterium]|nr:cation transporter [candidate division KSB1 bacterium]